MVILAVEWTVEGHLGAERRLGSLFLAVFGVMLCFMQPGML